MTYSGIHDLLPNGEQLLQLTAEELGSFLLEFLNRRAGSALNRHDFGLYHTVEDYPQPLQRDISRALMEAWMWLEREGFLAPAPGGDDHLYFVTRRGRSLRNHLDVEVFQRASRLPRGQLHPKLSDRIWPAFLRGDYETAVFQAFKEVEIAVRTAAKLDPLDIGTELMRKAFGTSGGPLTDASAPKSEREAVGHLFAGAIGAYKNPSSHRNMPITDGTVTIELLFLASHLLRIVDSRSAPASLS